MLTFYKFALSNKINLFGLMATLFIGQNKVFLPETDSTNSYAISLLKNVNCIEGTVVLTNNQTKGRGQRGNSWKADPSMNITLSLILKPGFLSSKKAFFLSKITALALYDVLTDILNESQFDIKIKWPNDILVNGKKIAGVLIENSVIDESLGWSVVGIGLNVNQTLFGALAETATSFTLLTGKTESIETISEKLYSYFEKWYLKLKQDKFNEINAAYLNHLFGINRLQNFKQNSINFKGTIKDVNEQGLLIVQLENGIEKSFEIKEISLVI